MRKTAFFALSIATVLAVAAAMFVSKQRAPESELAQSALFPGLAEHINDVARIEVKSKDGHTTVRKDGERWVIEDRGGYPALFDKVKATVVAVADLEVLEPKTTNKELYPRLGVEGIDAEPSSSVLVSLADGQSKPLAALLVGKPRSGGPLGTYVRRPDEPQAWLVRGQVEVSADPVEWMERELLNIAPERIREITIEKAGDKPVRVFKNEPKDKDFVLADLPKGTKLKSQLTLNGLANVLEQLRLDDVKKRAGFELPKGHTVTTLRGFDGLVAMVQSAVIDDKTHAVFEFSYDAAAAAKPEKTPPTPGPAPDQTPAAAPAAAGAEKPAGAPEATPAAAAAEKPAVAPEAPKSEAPAPQPTKPSVADEVATLNAKVAEWVYLLPSYKAKLLAEGLSDLTDPEGPELKKTAPKTK
jgi:Domain of unknown function (DUF4340)